MYIIPILKIGIDEQRRLIHILLKPITLKSRQEFIRSLTSFVGWVFDTEGWAFHVSSHGAKGFDKCNWLTLWFKESVCSAG